MESNNSKKTLKVIVPNITGSSFNNFNKNDLHLSNKTNLLLFKLGLYPLPENVQANISVDNKYLNIKLKDTPDKKHLLFQFPLEESDLSALESRPDYNELMDRYELYTKEYVNEALEYACSESQYIQEKFPGLVFFIKIRIKSPDSYKKKLNEHISTGKNPYINDIIAERIILVKYNENEERNFLKKNYANNEEILKQLYKEDEDDLRQMGYEVAKALYDDFRITTNFRINKDVTPNKANSSEKYITRDYIKHPKKSGYTSLHILMAHKNKKNFNYETQIRTLEMDRFSKISHSKYKIELLNDLSLNRVPQYYIVSSFVDESRKPTVIKFNSEDCFYNFYNSDINDKSNPITKAKFEKEKSKLEHLLGLEFKQIREKLKNIHSKEQKTQEVR